MVSKKKKVIIAISGGVDSSVAAYLLKKEGCEVIGLFMRTLDGEDYGESSARQVCACLGIKFYPINVSDIFKKEIINYFIESYRKGLTPNPCVKCNQVIKFGSLFKAARNFDGLFATGHYARIQEDNVSNKPVYHLLRGVDTEKDQSYFLYNLTQRQLGSLLFPIGNFKKTEIRKIADKERLPYQKKESQDICFLTEGGRSIEHNNFLKKFIKENPGAIKTMAGKTIGEHKGLPFYTIGQRRGIEIGGTGPYYAAKTDYKNNILYVVKDACDPQLFKGSLAAKEVNWISGFVPEFPFKTKAVIRYRHKPVEAVVSARKDNEISVKFKKPQRAVTPGQSIVFYAKDEAIGGGVIK